MSQKQSDCKDRLPIWYYFGFPFLALFRLATIFCRFIDYYWSYGQFPYSNLICSTFGKWVFDLYVWNMWWFSLAFLHTTYVLGRVVYPIYKYALSTIDVEIKTKKSRYRKIRNPYIPILAGRLCLFTEVHNVYAENIIYLQHRHFDYTNSVQNKIIRIWNDMRSAISTYPPVGWPLHTLMMLCMIVVLMINLCARYNKMVQSRSSSSKNQKCFQSESGNIPQPESFDTDSATVVVDNSANCMIWKNKEDFIPKTYKAISNSNVPMIDTAAGSGLPIAVGSVPVAWYDDDGVYHKFVLTDVFHVPDSPVNILGISAFSKIVGDYETKGTRINSSGTDSILTWDNEKYSRSFSHSSANMPALTVNDGFSVYHKFCNFIETIQPIQRQCYHVQTPSHSNVGKIPYKVGEEVLYKNVDHMEKGVIDKISTSDGPHNNALYHIKFRDNRCISTSADCIQANDETDVASIPISGEEYNQHAKCLTEQEIKLLKHPLPLLPIEREWKVLHDNLGHLSFSMMDRLVENNILPRKFRKMKNRPIICPSCVFGRMRRRAWRNKDPKSWRHIKKSEHSSPGAKVSTDQLVVAQPGLVPRISGRHTNERICGATGFFDHYSGYSYSALQTSLDGEQTLAAKNMFESHAASCGVKVKSYRADNGRFAEKSFIDAISSAQQTIDFCAVGAHHQNGVIERHFQTLSSKARTILLHAKRHWPEMITVVLWPFAYKYAELLYNHFHLDKTGYSPIQKFCGTTEQLPLQDVHTWGCPCFVLDADLQTNKMLAKWEPRSRLGIYLGHSPCHAGSVALVLNPRTLHISPQFHVAFDDNFSTVPFLTSKDIPPTWKDIVMKADHSSVEDYDLARIWVDSQTDPITSLRDQEGDITPSSNDRDESSREENAKVMQRKEGDKFFDELLQPTLPDINELSRRKSSRQSKPSEKALNSNDKAIKRMFGLATNLPTVVKQMESKVFAFVTHLENISTLYDDTINQCHYFIYNAVASTNDVYTLSQMLKLDDIKDFVIAMMKEVEDHESRDHWEIFERYKMPKGAKTILSVWAFKRKRLPDGTVYKHKARLNAHGGMQRWGIDYWETYAPVVNLISVRLLLVLSIVHKLRTKSIDFVLAFPQADITKDIYMELPYGFNYGKDKRLYVLKLKKNLYGLCDASYNWFNKITEGLESEGFVRSEIDQCVFLRNDCIILLYVDDMIALSKNNDVLENLVVNLRNKNYILTDEGSLSKYLGVDVKYKRQGYIELVQPFLIQRIIDLLGLEGDSKHNTKPTPAVKPLLHKDLKGESRKNNWNYRQAIGMMTYLQATTRPDIAMAVHQCARFSIKPMLSHERAVRRIGRYLLGNKDKGIIFKPNMEKGLECYVDADFAGGWSKEDVDQPDTVLSRTGFVVFYAGCPLVWASRMQTEIALSTAEAEYVACSTAMRDVLSLMELMKEINEIFPVNQPKPIIKCNVYEDNESCIAMAKNRKFSPRTKHIAIKYHHFRKHVNKTIFIESINTTEQTADMLTKPLETPQFTYLRNKLSGW